MNFLKYFKTIVFVYTMVFFVSCSNEVATSTDGLIDNDSFIVDVITSDSGTVLETKSVDFVYSNLLGTYLLGDYTNSDFGNINASFVSQIEASSYPLQRTTSETPENVTTTNVTVSLKIPLPLSENDDSGEYELVNSTGDISTVFDFTVSTFETSLEEFKAEEDDTSSVTYYSNGTNDTGINQDLGTLTELGTLLNYNFESSYTEVETLVIDLNADYFQENILDKLDDGEISTDEELLALFKGLKIDATIVSGEGLIVPFSLSSAELEIEYTNEEDGETLEKSLLFDLDGVLYNLYDHNHTNTAETNEFLVQGASGYNTTVDLSDFVTTYAAESVSDEWVINEGKLKMFVRAESDEDYSDVLSTLLIYLDNGEEVLTDLSNGVVNTEDVENPYVEFIITSIIEDALANGEIEKLIIKESRFETSSVDFRSTTVSGIVLLDGSEDETKAPVFELTYSRIND